MKDFKACIVPTASLTTLLLYCLLLGYVKNRWILQKEVSVWKDAVNTFYVGSSYKVDIRETSINNIYDLSININISPY